MAYLDDLKPLKLGDIARMRANGEKIAMLTSYDASFAAMVDRCGVDVVLVGDSLGNVVQGRPTTLSVTLEHMIYHTECVFAGMKRGFLIADMPFGSYHESPSQAMRNAALLMATGAQMVKIEGGAYMAETVRFLVERGVPVCAHIGLTPQAVHQLGCASAWVCVIVARRLPQTDLLNCTCDDGRHRVSSRRSTCTEAASGRGGGSG